MLLGHSKAAAACKGQGVPSLPRVAVGLNAAGEDE